MQLHYEIHGQGAPLILLHGLFGSRRNLQSMAKKLSGQYRVYLVDLRNHGQSPHMNEMDYPTMADDLAQFIQQQQIQKPVLIGHSMGGKVAMVNALKFPKRCKALVILDIAPVKYDTDYQPVIDCMMKIDPENISSRSEADKLMSLHFSNINFRQFLLQNLARDQNRFYWRLNLAGLRQSLDLITDFPDLPQAQFTQPVLFLGGLQSDYIHSNHTNRIKRLFPLASLKWLENAGHWLHAEQPEIVYHEINGFLNELI